jgi:hypothetical protein
MPHATARMTTSLVSMPALDCARVPSSTERAVIEAPSDRAVAVGRSARWGSPPPDLSALDGGVLHPTDLLSAPV